MTQIARNLADCAKEMVGVPFRFRGRNPDTGIDCIGLVALAAEKAGNPLHLPSGYSLRQADFGSVATIARSCNLVQVSGAPRRGDIAIFAVSPVQQHLAIQAGDELFIHAHAGLGRVVLGPADYGWSLVSTWRFRNPSPDER